MNKNCAKHFSSVHVTRGQNMAYILGSRGLGRRVMIPPPSQKFKLIKYKKLYYHKRHSDPTLGVQTPPPPHVNIFWICGYSAHGIAFKYIRYMNDFVVGALDTSYNIESSLGGFGPWFLSHRNQEDFTI